MPQRIFNKVKKIELTSKEKEDGLLNLSNFIKNNPIVNDATNQEASGNAGFEKGILSPWTYLVRARMKGRLSSWGELLNFEKYSVSRVPNSNTTSKDKFPLLSTLKQNKFMPILILIAVMFTGATAVSASSALPGDLLYPVKIHINENIDSLLAIGAKANAYTEISHANERLIELEKLADEGRLNADASAEAQNAFMVELNSADKHVSDLEKDGKKNVVADIKTDFKNSLSKHEKTISSIYTNTEIDSNVQTRVGDILGLVRARISTYDDTEDDADSDDDLGEDSDLNEKSKANTGIGASSSIKSSIKIKAKNAITNTAVASSSVRVNATDEDKTRDDEEDKDTVKGSVNSTTNSSGQTTTNNTSNSTSNSSSVSGSATVGGSSSGVVNSSVSTGVDITGKAVGGLGI